MIFDCFEDHFGEPFGIKIASKTRSKNQSDFGSIFDGFWLPFWAHFGPILTPKIDQKSRSIFVGKRDGLRIDFLGVRGTKNSSGESPKDQQDTDRYRSVCFTRPAVLRRIEHAARNTAAAPFCRRPSLEWPYKIWILLLRIGRLCSFLVSLGVSWSPFWQLGGPFWEPESFILVPWERPR